MNFRILAASIRPRGRVFALLAATGLSAALMVSYAGAQTPAPAPFAMRNRHHGIPAAPAAGGVRRTAFHRDVGRVGREDEALHVLPRFHRAGRQVAQLDAGRLLGCGRAAAAFALCARR